MFKSQTRVMQYISDRVKGRTYIFSVSIQHPFITALTSFSFITMICYNLYTPLFPQEKLNTAFQSQAPHLTFWYPLQGLGNPDVIFRTLKTPPVFCIVSPEGTSPKWLSFSNVSAQSFLNLYLWRFIVVYIGSCFMYCFTYISVS